MRLLFAAIAAALCGVLVLQWHGWHPSAPAAPVSSSDAAASASPTELPQASDLLLPPPAKEEYASVSERPLFLPDRRPPPAEPEDEEESLPDELSDLAGTDLNAVLITPALVSAWVRAPGSQELTRLRLGDDFEGWTVSGIEPDRLVLERQGETNELILRDYANAPAAPPPTVRGLADRRRVGSPTRIRQGDGATAGQRDDGQEGVRRMPQRRPAPPDPRQMSPQQMPPRQTSPRRTPLPDRRR